MSADISSLQPVGYSPIARFWHWIAAILVLIMIPLGLAIANLEMGAIGDSLYNLHKSLGALIMVIMLLRLAYRLTHPAPPMLADIALPQRLVAHVVHWGLYALVIAQTFIGYIGTSAYPSAMNFFGLFPLPSMWPENRALSDKLFVLHGYVGYAIGALVVMHIAGALYHQFIRKDGLILRMMRS